MLKNISFFLISIYLIGCTSSFNKAQNIRFPKFDRKFHDLQALKTIYYEGKGCQDEIYRYDNFKSFIDSLVNGGDTTIWQLDDGMLMKAGDGKYVEVDYARYSEIYKRKISTYATQNDIDWLSDYVEKYNIFNDISPSLVAMVYDIDFSEIQNKVLEKVLIVHYITACYQADPKSLLR